MRDIASAAGTFKRDRPDEHRIVLFRSLPASGTAEPSRTLSKAMPICRIHVSPSDAAPQPEKVRLSRYIVTRRTAPRAANDNRDPSGGHLWHWAAVIAVAPTVTAVLLFAGLF